MALKLYHGEPNGPSLTVLAALFEKGVDAELKRIDLVRGERHGAGVERSTEIEMSIEGEGPVLVADGEPMADSVFVAIYLDDVGSGPALRPADPYRRWQMMMWCRQLIERLAPAAAFLGTREYLAPALQAMDQGAFDAAVGRIASPDLAERWRNERDGRFPDEQLADSRAKVRQFVERVETRLGDQGEGGGEWLLGEFSIADLETYAWLAGMVDLVPDAFADAPNTRAWLRRVEQRPSVQKALALATTNDPRKVWAVGPEINRWG